MQEKLAIYPGTFDPITNGHLDILQRALSIFDKVIIAISGNNRKVTLFNVEERAQMLRDSTQHLPRVTVDQFHCLLVEYAQKKGASAVIRGIRAVSDFEYEFQMALMNRRLSQNYSSNLLETVYLMPDEKYTYLSSTLVKEISRLKGDVSSFVPKPVFEQLTKKFS